MPDASLEDALDRVYAAALAVSADERAAAEVTRRVLLTDPRGCPDVLAARGARLAVPSRMRRWSSAISTRTTAP